MGGNQRAPQDKICSYEYTVKRGDSFYLIAHRLGVPLRDLLEANSEINPARLMVGDILCIPMEEDDAVQEPAKTNETQEGSTPAPEATPPLATEPAPSVSQSTTQTEIVETEIVELETESLTEEPADWLDHPAVMESEQMNTPIIEARVTETAPQTSQTTQRTAERQASQSAAQPEPSATGAAETTQACPDCPNGDCYTVASGETIIDIERATDRTLYTLQVANPSTDLDALKAGDRLCVPKENTLCPTAKGYIMGADETLESVALKLDVSVGALLRANPCLAPSGFVAGKVICLPAD